MGKKVPQDLKIHVIRDWLQAVPRNEIAVKHDISTGSVTNIIKKVRIKGIEDIDLLREVSLILKNENMELTSFADSIELKNKLDDLGFTEERVDSFLEEVSTHCFKKEIDDKDFLKSVHEVCMLADNYDLSIQQIPEYIENLTKIKDDDI